MTDNEKIKKSLKNLEEKTICQLIGHDERVFPTEDEDGSIKYEIHCKRCKEYLDDIKSFYDD